MKDLGTSKGGGIKIVEMNRREFDSIMALFREFGRINSADSTVAEEKAFQFINDVAYAMRGRESPIMGFEIVSQVKIL